MTQAPLCKNCGLRIYSTDAPGAHKNCDEDFETWLDKPDTSGIPWISKEDFWATYNERFLTDSTQQPRLGKSSRSRT